MGNIVFENIKDGIDTVIDNISANSPQIFLGGIVVVGICTPIVLNLTVFKDYKYVQICDEYTDLSDEDLYINKDGEYCKTFEEGEHIIKVSRKTGGKHEYEEVEGYTIQSVEFKPYAYSSEVIYVNDEDIIAVGELDNNNLVEFNDFGKVRKKVK